MPAATPVTPVDRLGNVIGGSGSGTTAQTVQGGSAAGTTASGNPVAQGVVYNTTAPTLTNGQVTYQQADSRGNSKVAVVSLDGTVGLPFTNAGLSVLATPTTTAANSITPVVGVGSSSLVVKASAGNLYSASMVAGATAGFLIAYNANAAPAAGAALTASLVLGIAQVGANGYANLGGDTIPDRFSAGITLLFSTSSTTYTVPANLALHMKGKAA